MAGQLLAVALDLGHARGQLGARPPAVEQSQLVPQRVQPPHHVRAAEATPAACRAFVLLGGLFDIFDGRVARLSGLGSKFGAFYDSTLDRISETVMFLGMLSLYNDYRLQLGDVGMIYLIMLAMAGSQMISYTRARAEAMGIDCRVGLMPRAERIVLIGSSALFFGESWNGLVLKGVILVLAVLTKLTAIQRIFWVYKNARGVPVTQPAPKPTLEHEITSTKP